MTPQYRSQLIGMLWWLIVAAFLILVAIEQRDHQLAVIRYCNAVGGEIIRSTCWVNGQPLNFGQ